MVEVCAKKFIVIVDDSKMVPGLGITGCGRKWVDRWTWTRLPFAGCDGPSVWLLLFYQCDLARTPPTSPLASSYIHTHTRPRINVPHTAPCPWRSRPSAMSTRSGPSSAFPPSRYERPRTPLPLSLYSLCPHPNSIPRFVVGGSSTPPPPPTSPNQPKAQPNKPHRPHQPHTH